MKELKISATVESIPVVTAFVNEQLEALDCPVKAQAQIDIAIDEIFSNIAKYAYNPEIGEATVRVEVREDPLRVIITFIDGGVPYDPLTAAEPATGLSTKERSVGGLGIFIVRKSMDDITYRYEEGRNILTVQKKIDSG
jgi:anti-sigma regulatory factor (Ser/Thr protein kinase)